MHAYRIGQLRLSEAHGLNEEAPCSLVIRACYHCTLKQEEQSIMGLSRMHSTLLYTDLKQSRLGTNNNTNVELRQDGTGREVEPAAAPGS